MRTRLKRLLVLGAGTLVFSSGILGATILFSQKNVQTTPMQQQKDVREVYDKIAKDFDSDINCSEWVGGIRSARKKLAAKATVTEPFPVMQRVMSSRFVLEREEIGPFINLIK